MQPYSRASLSITPSLSSLSITPTQNKGTASPTVRIPRIISPQVRSIVVGPFHSQVQFYPVFAKTEIIKAQTLWPITFLAVVPNLQNLWEVIRLKAAKLRELDNHSPLGAHGTVVQATCGSLPCLKPMAISSPVGQKLFESRNRVLFISVCPSSPCLAPFLEMSIEFYIF